MYYIFWPTTWAIILQMIIIMIMISECSNLAQKVYKTKHDWASKVILEKDTHKHLWDFDIQTDHLISDRRLDLIIINKMKRELAELWTLLSRLTTE